MATPQNKIHSTDELLKAVEQLKPREFDTFIAKTLALRAKRNAKSLSRKESNLLLKINQGLPRQAQNRFNELIEKRQAETLTFKEHQEFLKLVNRIEKTDARRIEWLGELAQIRQQPVKELMKELGVGQSEYV